MKYTVFGPWSVGQRDVYMVVLWLHWWRLLFYLHGLSFDGLNQLWSVPSVGVSKLRIHGLTGSFLTLLPETDPCSLQKTKSSRGLTANRWPRRSKWLISAANGDDSWVDHWRGSKISHSKHHHSISLHPGIKQMSNKAINSVVSDTPLTAITL